MISSVKAKEMLRKGCLGYLAHIMNKINEVVSGVKDTLVVQEFPDVFLDSFSRSALE